MHPSQQFQIGQRVLYVPEGVLTEVTGYEWGYRVDGPPFIALYELSCGVYAGREHIERVEKLSL